MIDPTALAATARPVPPCPPWCSPADCEVTESDVQHLSAPTRVETLDASFTLQLIRCDELAYPAEWDRAPGVLFGVESKSCAAPDGTPLSVGTEIATTELWVVIGALAGHLALAGGVS
jgi:hypothetical protein